LSSLPFIPFNMAFLRYTITMKSCSLLLALMAGLPVWAQTVCPPAPAYSPCDIVFELSEEEARAHPNPYLSVELQAEFRSPRYRTFLMPAFWDGGGRMVIRFTPTDPGSWDFRVASNIQRFDGKMGRVEATQSDSPGFLRARNVHHWGYTETNLPHLWMGDTCYRFGFLDRAIFDKVIEARAQQKFNHLRGLLIGGQEESRTVFPSPDQVNPEYFRQMDERILAMNRKGIIADLVLAGDHLAAERALHKVRHRPVLRHARDLARRPGIRRVRERARAPEGDRGTPEEARSVRPSEIVPHGLDLGAALRRRVDELHRLPVFG
jgi:hypothetical protein